MVFVWWTFFISSTTRIHFGFTGITWLKRFSLRWVPRRGQSELPWSKYPRSNISGHVNLISNDQNFDQKCDPKFRLYHQKLKYFSSSKSWLFYFDIMSNRRILTYLIWTWPEENTMNRKLYFGTYLTFKVKETQEEPSARNVTEQFLFHHFRRSFE